jgi:hypothetical protein
MKTVTLDVRTPREVSADFVRAWKTRKADRNARISFGGDHAGGLSRVLR